MPSSYDETQKWNEVKSSKMWTFQLGDHPELIHIIKTGFRDLYIVVHEDAYELHLGKTHIWNKQKVEETFNIKLK